ncbi:MAG: hypothetical protein V4510_12050 [bacterium]
MSTDHKPDCVLDPLHRAACARFMPRVVDQMFSYEEASRSLARALYPNTFPDNGAQPMLWPAPYEPRG